MQTQPASGEAEVLWAPTSAQIDSTRLAAYQRWLAAEKGLASHAMPGADWYPNVCLNYAEHVFRHASADRPALIARSEDSTAREVSWAELRRDTGALAARLRSLGIGAGDRVASYLPNRPETVVAFLACASIGAVWSSCAPGMGATIVLDRLRQIEPQLLLATDSYSYNGKTHDRMATVDDLLRELPSVKTVLHVPGPLATVRPVVWRDRMPWAEAIRADAELGFERVPFSHPLWIVYSSGNTGLPKAMVHRHGGIVLTHLKTMALQHDLGAGDRLLFLGGTGWIVWNLQLGALLTGASIVLYDGNPAWPDGQALWRFIDEQRVSLFGCGAAYLINCMKDGLRPREFAAMTHLRAINSTGSPLPMGAYRWVYSAVKSELWLASISGAPASPRASSPARRRCRSRRARHSARNSVWRPVPTTMPASRCATKSANWSSHAAVRRAESGLRAGCRVEVTHRTGDSQQGLGPACAERDLRGRGNPTHADGQADGSAGAQAAGTRSQVRMRWPIP